MLENNSLHKKMKFSVISLVNLSVNVNVSKQFSADLFTFSKEILNGKLHFLFNVLNRII